MANRILESLDSLFAESSLVAKVKPEPIVFRPPSPAPSPSPRAQSVPSSPPPLANPSVPEQLAAVVEEIVQLSNKNAELAANIEALQKQLSDNCDKINNHKRNIKEIIKSAPEDQHVELSTFARNMLAKKTHKIDNVTPVQPKKSKVASNQPTTQTPTSSANALKRKTSEQSMNNSPTLNNVPSPRNIPVNYENNHNNNNIDPLNISSAPENAVKKPKHTPVKTAIGSIVLDNIKTLDYVRDFSVKSYYRDSHHMKKLRTLQVGPNNYFATSSRDGYLKFWKLKCSPYVSVDEWGSLDQRNLSSYVNALAWSPSGKRLALGMFIPENSQSRQLIILNTEGIETKNVGTRQVEGKPHTKTINAICFAGETDEDKLFTAGSDKKIYQWSLSEKRADHRLIHSEHTNELLCILSPTSQPVLLSGAQDKKLVSWSLEHEKASSILRFDAPVSNIKQNPVDINTMLIGLRARDNQLQLLDSRSYKIPLKLTSQWTTPMSPNQFTQCNWHPNGYVIASGGEPQVVTLWDIRYVKAEQPFQTLTLHQKEKRVYQSTFVNPSTMVTYAADKKIGVHTLT